MTYAAVLAYFLHVRSTPVPGPTPNAPSSSRTVPSDVLNRLFQLKQSLSILEDYGFSVLDDDDEDDDDDDEEETVDGTGEEEEELDEVEQATAGFPGVTTSTTDIGAWLADMQTGEKNARAAKQRRSSQRSQSTETRRKNVSSTASEKAVSAPSHNVRIRSYLCWSRASY